MAKDNMEQPSGSTAEAFDPLDNPVTPGCFIRIKRFLGGNEWLDLGRLLKLNENTLAQIKAEERLFSEQAQQMYNKWTQTLPEKATHRVLREALEDLNRKDIADKVKACMCFNDGTEKITHPKKDSKTLQILETIRRHLVTRYAALSVNGLPGNSEECMPINTCFADMQYCRYDSRESKKIALNEIFESLRSGARLLLHGGYGSGKTATAAKLLYDWGTSEGYINKLFDLVVLISGNDSADNLYGTLVNALDMDFIPKEDILAVITDPSVRLLLIIDDYERIPHKKERQLMSVIRKEFLPDAIVLIICRTPNIDSGKSERAHVSECKYVAVDIRQYIEKVKLEVLGITVKSVNIQDNVIIKTGLLACSGYADLIVQQLKKVLSEWAEGKEEFEIYPLYLTLLTEMLINTAGCQRNLTEIHLEFYKLLSHHFLNKEHSSFQSSLNSNEIQNLMQDFGKFAFQFLTKRSLIGFSENSAKSQRKFIDIGFHFRVVDGLFVPVIKAIVEFAAAFYVANALLGPETPHSSDVEASVTQMRPCYRNSSTLYYYFLVGLMKERSTLLFESLKPYSAEYSSSFGNFGLSLTEITWTETFHNFLLPLLPIQWKIPCIHYPLANLGRRCCEFHISTVHKHLIRFSTDSDHTQVFRWDLQCPACLPEYLEVKWLILDLTNTTHRSISPIKQTITCDQLHCLLPHSYTESIAPFWGDFLKEVLVIKFRWISFEIQKDSSLWLPLILAAARIKKELQVIRWVTCNLDEEVEPLTTITELIQTVTVKGLQLVVRPAINNTHQIDNKDMLEKKFVDLLKAATKSKLNRLIVINKGQAFSIDWPILCRPEVWKWIQLTDLNINYTVKNEKCTTIKIKNLDLSPKAMPEKTAEKVLLSIQPEVSSLNCSSTLLVKNNISFLKNCLTGLDIRIDDPFHDSLIDDSLNGKDLADILKQFPKLEVLAVSIMKLAEESVRTPLEKWLRESDSGVSLKGLEIWGTEADICLSMKLVELISWCMSSKKSYAPARKKQKTDKPDVKLKLKYIMLNIGSVASKGNRNNETVKQFMAMAMKLKKLIHEKVLPQLDIVYLDDVFHEDEAPSWVQAFPPTEGFTVSHDYWGMSHSDSFRSREAFNSCPVECSRFRITSSTI